MTTIFFVAAGLAVSLAVLVVGNQRLRVWRKDLAHQLNAESQVVETARGPIEYRLLGGSGPVLLSIHGSPGGHDQFSFDLSAAPWPMRAVVPSRPGYLRTPISVGRTAAEQADAYAALLDALGIESVVVFGASGGGPSALAFAGRHADRTRGLILYAPVSQPLTVMGLGPMAVDVGAWPISTFLLAKAQRVVRLLVKGKANQERILASKVLTDDLKASATTILPPSLRRDGWKNDIKMFRQLPLDGSSITCPTLILHGTEDRNVPYGQSKALLGQIAGAELVGIEGADHFMRWSHPVEVGDAIAAFLSAHCSPVGSDGS